LTRSFEFERKRETDKLKLIGHQGTDNQMSDNVSACRSQLTRYFEFERKSETDKLGLSDKV
jgi:hypothetical protein